MRDSTARSVSVTRSTAIEQKKLGIGRVGDWSHGGKLAILFGTGGFGGGMRGGDGLACALGEGDHEVVDFLEVEVGHCEGCVWVWVWEVQLLDLMMM